VSSLSVLKAWAALCAVPTLTPVAAAVAKYERVQRAVDLTLIAGALLGLAALVTIGGAV
jgi:hypothetical protein